MNRELSLEQASDPSIRWDVVVIGGGATGLGTALDSASRGFKTLLLEASDFAKGTSSRSTKLIHGGVRYLRQGQVGMVRESLRERGRLLQNAAPIVHPLRMVIPSFRRGRRWYFYGGLKAYDLLAGRLGLEPACLLSSKQTIDALPTLNASGLHGGVAFSDGQFDDARLAVALASTASRLKATVLNYAPVTRLQQEDGKVSVVVFRDLEGQREYEVRAKVVVNATGVFSEQILEMDPGKGTPERIAPRIVPSQGTHLVVSKDFLPTDHAMMIPDTDDGRVLFAIPWLGSTLIGTTDTAVDTVCPEPIPLEAEIDYLLAHVGRYLSKSLGRDDVLSMFSGLRPLVAQSGSRSTSSLSREHEIDVSPSGLISVIGGKWTTYRQMGEDVTNMAARVGGLPSRASETADMRLGNQDSSLNGVEKADDLTEAHIAAAVQSEMARTVEDVLARRTRLLFLNASEAIQAASKVAASMMPLLARDEGWCQSQINSFRSVAQNYLPTKEP